MDGKRIAALLTAGALTLLPGLIRVLPAAAAGSAPGAPGSNATWDESQVTGFADSLGASSKVWYTLGNGELENVFYPETDNPDTFGLQYVVTNGSSFASTETTGTSHTITLADPDALVWLKPVDAASALDTELLLATRSPLAASVPPVLPMPSLSSCGW